MSVDPLATDFPFWSPYNYVFNNPILLKDPTGMGPKGESSDIGSAPMAWAEEKIWGWASMSASNIQRKFNDIMNMLFKKTEESAKNAPEFAIESAENTASEIGMAIGRMPAYGLRTLEVSATGADVISEGSNYIALGALAFGQPEIAAGAFAFGRAAGIYSLGAKSILTIANPEQYAREGVTQLIKVGSGEIGGRFVFGATRYNTVAERFINSQGRFIQTTVGNENFTKRFMLNYTLQFVK